MLGGMPPKKRAATVPVDPEVWEEALDAAQGDPRRIVVEPPLVRLGNVSRARPCREPVDVDSPA